METVKATNISSELAEIINLRSTADIHAETCPGQSCNVSLFMLRNTADRLLKLVPIEETKEAMEYFIGWPS